MSTQVSVNEDRLNKEETDKKERHSAALAFIEALNKQSSNSNLDSASLIGWLQTHIGLNIIHDNKSFDDAKTDPNIIE